MTCTLPSKRPLSSASGVALAALVLLCGAARPARAQERGGGGAVSVRVQSCEALPFDLDAFMALLRLELAEDGVDFVLGEETGQEDVLASIRVGSHCDDAELPSETIRIELVDHLTRKELTRDLDLSGLPLRSRARLSALGVAELLRASWAELAMATSPPPALPVPPRVRAAVRVTARDALGDPRAPSAPAASVPGVLSLELGPEARIFASGNAALAGGYGMLDVPLDAVLSLRIGAAGGATRATHPLGEAELVYALGALGVEVGADLSPLRLALAPMLEAGWGRVASVRAVTGVVARAGEAPLLLARVDASAALRVAEVLDVVFAIGVGYALMGLRAEADGAAFSGITGTSVHARIGVRLHVR